MEAARVVVIAALLWVAATVGAPGSARAELPEEWTGTISVHERSDAVSGKLTGIFTFGAADGGTITGTGNGDFVNDEGGFLVDLAVTGTRRADSVHLVLTVTTTRAPGGRDLSVDHTIAATVPLLGTTAEGPLVPGDDYPKGWVRLECTSCLSEETWTGGVEYDHGSGPTRGEFRFTVSDAGVVSGSGEGMWDYLGEEEVADITVTGTRRADTVELSISASSKGDSWTFEVTVPVNGQAVHLEENQNASPRTWPRWSLDVACLNC